MTTTSQFSNSKLFRFAAKAQMLLLSLTFTLLALTGCFENVKGITLTPKLTTTTAATYTSSGAFTLSKVVLNQNDPAGTFDVWDNGSTSIAKYCPSTTSGTTTTINCSCVFDFQYTDQSTSVTTSQEILVDPSYAEGDLVRCPYAQIPASVTSVGVSIQTKDGASKSSQITYTFGMGTGVLDTSKEYNFNRIYRYTCRLKAYVPNAMDLTSGIYDPDQSEKDPSNTYAMSFYTSNLGASIDAFAGNNPSSTPITDYECPANPLHPDPAYAETIYSTSSLSGDWVISGNPNHGASQVDMNANNPRSTFYLSKVKTGVFTVNVNAYIAPSIISQAVTTPNAQGGGIPSLGWGAQPRSTGAGTEKCPDPTPGSVDYVTIPSGYQWVKVWLFRMPLPNRQFYYGANLQRLGMIGCNPGNWPTNAAVPEVTDCGTLASLGSTAGAGGSVARFTNGTWMCFKPSADFNVSWSPNGIDTNYSCGKPNQAAWANTWSQNYTGGLDICDASGAATTKIPYDHSPTAQYIDNQQSSRYEFFFVVTPPSVNTGDMSNSASPVYAQYAPFRFRTDSDCDKLDPSTCSTQFMWRNYGLKLHDVADAGDPPASDPSRAGVFPVCALQPIM